MLKLTEEQVNAIGAKHGWETSAVLNVAADLIADWRELRRVVEFYAEWWPDGVEPDGGKLARQTLGLEEAS